MGHHTPLHDKHLKAEAKMVDFAGWDMPLHYGSVIEEHHAVRRHAGIFDVSHMSIVDVAGLDSKGWLQRLLANDVGRLAEGHALYTAMLNEQGGVIDDLIVYRLPGFYRLVTNCATREKDWQWLLKHHDSAVTLTDRPEFAMLALHGPDSIRLACETLSAHGVDAALVDKVAELGNFRCLQWHDWFIARTGYTGEKGLEIMMPSHDAGDFWERLMAASVQPVGLGARDTLRLEAGMNLYGQEMDEGISPFLCNMGRTLAWEPAERDFIGRAALEAQRRDWQKGRLPALHGLRLDKQLGMLRKGQAVFCKHGNHRTIRAQGLVTSGSFSPTLGQSIALARLPAGARYCEVEVRGRRVPVEVGEPVFVRHGKPVQSS